MTIYDSCGYKFTNIIGYFYNKNGKSGPGIVSGPICYVVKGLADEDLFGFGTL